MAADLQSVNAALSNLDARLVASDQLIIEAKKEAKEAKETTDKICMALQREVGATIASFRAEMAQFRTEAQQEFQSYKASLEEMQTEAGKLLLETQQD